MNAKDRNELRKLFWDLETEAERYHTIAGVREDSTETGFHNWQGKAVSAEDLLANLNLIVSLAQAAADKLKDSK
jgi:hypothetical protein